MRLAGQRRGCHDRKNEGQYDRLPATGAVSRDLNKPAYYFFCTDFVLIYSALFDTCPQIAKTMQAVINELIKRSDKMADDIFEAIDGINHLVCRLLLAVIRT
jgi:hypothetical protein